MFSTLQTSHTDLVCFANDIELCQEDTRSASPSLHDDIAASCLGDEVFSTPNGIAVPEVTAASIPSHSPRLNLGSSPSAPLTGSIFLHTSEEAQLFRHFIETLGPWVSFQMFTDGNFQIRKEILTGLN